MSKRTWTMCISLKKKRNYYHSFDTLTCSVWGGLVLVRNDLEALADDEDDHNEQENLDHLHLKKTRRNYYHSFDTLRCSVWVGLVMVKNDLEAQEDDDEDHNEQENLDQVHLLEDKDKLLPFLCNIDTLCLGWSSIGQE